MPQSPFLGKLNLDQMHVHMQKERQESFESRIIEAIFRNAGISTPKLRMLLKRLNAGTALNKYNMIWFNAFANFPAKLSARRFHSKRRFSEFLKELQLGTYFMKTPEVLALLDLKDGYPNELVAFISRYPDWGMDMVFHTLEVDVSDTSFQLLRKEDGIVYKVEQLQTFLRRFTEEWELQNVFPEV